MSGFLGRSPSELRALPASDFTELAAYSKVQPFGVRRDDWHHSKTQAMIANALSTLLYAMGASRQRKTHSPADFMYGQKPKQKTPQQKKLELDNYFRQLKAQQDGNNRSRKAGSKA